MTPDISEAVANATLAPWPIGWHERCYAKWEVRRNIPEGPERDEILAMLGLS